MNNSNTKDNKDKDTNITIVDTNEVIHYKGKRYKINEEKLNPHKNDNGRKDQILRDFIHCESKRDWDTISNRILNGMYWGWLNQI